ncbi:MAG: S9 family peptidase [Pirellulaceae bacterium]|nr:S9 family peptidase [Pirellulaceae bacterium]
MKKCLVLSVGLMMIAVQGMAQTGYRLPPPEVVEIIDATPEPGVNFSPNGEWMVFVERDAMPGIEDLARRMLQLAGTRIDPVANSDFRTDFFRGVSLQRRGDNRQMKLIARGDNAKVSGMAWSHDSRHFGWTQVTDQGTELWVVDVTKDLQPKRLTDRLSTVIGFWDFTPDGNHVVCTLVPKNRGAEPERPLKPVGPNIQESIGNTSPVRTYQDLLENPYDEELFEHYATTQLAKISVKGEVAVMGEPGMYSNATPSPNGQFLLVSQIKRPFSYLHPYSSFPSEMNVWTIEGNKVVTVAEIPLAENIPIEGVRLGPRSIRWSHNDPARLMWYEALDGGDPKNKVPYRDRLMVWDAPFSEGAKEVLKTEHRAMGLSFFTTPGLVASTDMDRDRRWLRTQMVQLNDPSVAPVILDDRSMRDRYADPGRMVSRSEATGHSLVRQDGDWVYLVGAGASPSGDRPFLDRRHLVTQQTERLWQSREGALESVAQILNSSANSKPQVIIRRESPTDPPNYFLVDLEAGNEASLTQFGDPTPQIRGIRKELVKYNRADGVPLSATLYLPADYQPGTRLPLMIWAYPLEFSDAATAGQVSASPNQFIRMTGLSHLALLTQGYAIMDNATMPVIGDPETMNDTFIEQIVGAAQAAIDKAVELGVADRDRVCVGGHSYGGFMTANLMAHCDLFRAGVARSGAYNRTLTPFGFQSERRPFWEAKDVYMNISPFTHADKIKRPLLLIHGENDNNSGTFPIQSQRLYQAIKGNGGTVRLVMLPHESHGYRARESVLHAHAETIEWLNRYVRDVETSESSTSATNQ